LNSSGSSSNRQSSNRQGGHASIAVAATQSLEASLRLSLASMSLDDEDWNFLASDVRE
jgi:hypothetical protein